MKIYGHPSALRTGTKPGATAQRYKSAPKSKSLAAFSIFGYWHALALNGFAPGIVMPSSGAWDFAEEGGRFFEKSTG
jgi:hypothetical protein